MRTAVADVSTLASGKIKPPLLEVTLPAATRLPLLMVCVPAKVFAPSVAAVPLILAGLIAAEPLMFESTMLPAASIALVIPPAETEIVPLPVMGFGEAVRPPLAAMLVTVPPLETVPHDHAAPLHCNT